ncbi:MAG: hypothetical protein V3U98_04835 [Acidobacteriota bacterium]
MMRSIVSAFFIMALGASLPASAQADQAVSPADAVREATDRHLTALSEVLKQVPVAVHSRIEKAMEISRKGGRKALEALERAHLSGEELDALMSRSQARGLERAIEAIEKASARVSEKLGNLINRVSQVEARQALADAIEHIQAARDGVLARLDRLLQRGVSTARPPERPDVTAPGSSARPSDLRPARPDVRPQDLLPVIVRPVRPDRPEPPARPEGRP